MAISCFDQKDFPPDQARLEKALGHQWAGWKRITQFMLESYQLPGVLQYGGKNYGWNLYYKRAGKPLLSLYPRENGLTAQVVLGKAEVEKALALPLGEAVGKALREAPAFHDGKWLFLQPANPQDIEDILRLISTKARPKKSPPAA